MQANEEDRAKDTVKSQSDAATTVQLTDASHVVDGEVTPTLISRRSGRGISVRRRIGLTIEADESLEAGGAAASDGSQRGGHEGGANVNPDSKPAGAADEWWTVEYKKPPPGHLGAHAVHGPSATASIEIQEQEQQEQQPSPTAQGLHSIEATGRDLERMEVTAVEAPRHQHQPRTHETPERATRRLGNELYDATTSHSSPNQKRKIIALQNPSMGVAKEPKRFHEPNGEQHYDADPPSPSPSPSVSNAAITPSNLLHPMTKIDIQAGSSSSSQAASASLAAHTTNGKASETA